MKKLIVIGAYPNTPKKEEVLINEINSLKGLGFDFMLVSHYPISVEIQNMVDYYIYDKNQNLTPIDKTTYYWLKTDSFIVRVNNSRHALPISQSMNNAFKFSEIKNYDFVYFIENDNLFSEVDAKKLNDLVDKMVNQNKKCIFFKPENYKDNNSYVYETQLFGLTPKYFNKVFKLPITEEDYFDYDKHPISLELGFYHRLSHFENDFLIINQHSYEYFNESEINIFRTETMVVELVYNTKEPEIPVLFCHGNKITEQNYRVIIKLDDEVITDTEIIQSYWFYKKFNFDDKKLEIEVYCDGTLQEIKTYILNKELKEKINNNGRIDFN